MSRQRHLPTHRRGGLSFSNTGTEDEKRAIPPAAGSVEPPASGWGVDTVRLAFPVDLAQCDRSSSLWSTTGSRNLTEEGEQAVVLHGVLSAEYADVRVTLYEKPGTCHLHFNAARVALEDPVVLLPPEALSLLVERLLDIVRPVAWPTFYSITSGGEIVLAEDWASRVKVKRLDLARNFEVDDVDRIKAGLTAAQGKYVKTRTVHTSGKAGWTLEHKTKRSGSDRMYDKSAELEAKGLVSAISEVTPRLLRFETQLQAERLTAYGLERLAQVNRASAWRALAERWDATGWGSPLPGPGGVADAVASLLPRERLELVGYLHYAALGIEDGLTPRQRDRIRRLAKQAGVVPGTPMDVLGPPSSRLDLAEGGEAPWAVDDLPDNWVAP